MKKLLNLKLNICQRILLAALLTLIAIPLVYFLKIPNPNLILFLVLNISLVITGFPGGMVSAILVMAYSCFFFSTGHDFVTFKPINLQKVMVTAVCIVLDIVLLGTMYQESRKTLKQKNELLEEALGRDELTHIKNRRAFRDFFETLPGHKIFLCYLDIDHFKRFNDDYSHETGDAVLKIFANTLISWFGYDHCFRVSGDELVIAIPFTSMEDFQDKDRQAREALRKITMDGKQFAITGSCGCIIGTPENAEDVRSMLRQADKALHEAKEGGRDRISIQQFEK